ncbi:MAG: hypothetical protein ABJE47_15775 [bacterium]
MTALRVVEDITGRVWSIFEAHPNDRRFSTQDIAEHNAASWLCFRHMAEVRRIRPVPQGWQVLGDDGLLRLLETAGPTGKRARMARPVAYVRTSASLAVRIPRWKRHRTKQG